MKQIIYNAPGEFNHAFDGKQLSIQGPVNRRETEICIPPFINGYPVVSIGKSAFADCTSLRRVTVPDTVVSIENSAFKGCSSLREVVLSSQLDSVGALAFAGCSAMRKITISNHTIRIEINTYKDCHAVEEVAVKIREHYVPDYVRLGLGHIYEDPTLWGKHLVDLNHGVPVSLELPEPFRTESGEYEDQNTIEHFAVASGTDEILWLYMRAVTRATNPGGYFMDKYDATFLEVNHADDRFRVAVSRLRDPAGLTENAETIYRNALKNMIDDVIAADQVERLTAIGELGCLDDSLLDRYISQSIRIGGNCTAYLLDRKNRLGRIGNYDFSL